MNIHDVPRDIQVRLRITLIKYDKEQVKPAHDGRTHRHISPQRFLAVVPPANRVGRCQDRCPRVERCVDPSFRDGYGLLFHGLVNSDLVADVHLVELVDGADAVVS